MALNHPVLHSLPTNDWMFVLLKIICTVWEVRRCNIGYTLLTCSIKGWSLYFDPWFQCWNQLHTDYAFPISHFHRSIEYYTLQGWHLILGLFLCIFTGVVCDTGWDWETAQIWRQLSQIWPGLKSFVHSRQRLHCQDMEHAEAKGNMDDLAQEFRRSHVRLKTVRDHRFVCAAPGTWNSIPLHIRSAGCPAVFKDHTLGFHGFWAH